MTRTVRTPHLDSYYLRHRSERLEYQQRYNAAKRTGRRKLSKRDRTVKELDTRAQLEGRRPVYINSIVQRDPSNDPTRTPAMVSAEEALQAECLYLESSAREIAAEHWIPLYVVSLQHLLDARLTAISSCSKSSEASAATIADHRLLTILYQEIQLVSQGVRIRAQAVEDRALVSMGRSEVKLTMLALSALADVVDGIPEMEDISLKQLMLFHHICCDHKSDILLTLPALDGKEEPPMFLPPSLDKFLTNACHITSFQVQQLWLLLRESLWHEGDLSSEEALKLKDLYRDYGHPVGLTYKTLYPPIDSCQSDGCGGHGGPLKKAEAWKAALFTLGEGVLPVWVVRLYCDKCRVVYHNNFWVKDREREYYRDSIPDYVQVGKHHFAERRLIDMWISGMLFAWTSAGGAAKTYNDALQCQDNWDPTWKPSQNVRTDHVWDTFVIVSLLEDAMRRGSVLHVPDDGSQRERFDAATQARNVRISACGQDERMHWCHQCVRILEPNDQGPRKVSMVVIDGVVMGRPCCAYHPKDPTEPPCTDNLVNNRDRFCPKHLSDGGKTCYVRDCGEPARPGYRTCQDPAHEQAESRYSMSKGSSSRRLAARLKRQKIAQTQNEESSEDEEDDCVSDEERPIEVKNEEVAGEDREDRPAEVKVKVQFGRKQTHNEQLFVAPCGMIIARETFFRSEAYSSVLEMLKRVYPRQMLLPDHVSYDSSCIVGKMAGGDSYFDNVVFTVDVFHYFCKHSKKDEYCQTHCNPKEHPELVDEDGDRWFFNTSICEQTNNWIGKYLPMCREMRGDKYTFFLDELILRRNAKLREKLVKEGHCPDYWQSEFFAQDQAATLP